MEIKMASPYKRPREIALRGDLILVRQGGLDWAAKNHPDLPGIDPMPLRDLLHRLTSEPSIRRAYGGIAASGSDRMTPLYAMISEIRENYGAAFPWRLEAPDASAILLLDELDDAVCESRAWLRGGGITPFVERQVANGPTLRSREMPEPAQHQRARASFRRS
jgi:hypothetical protein